MSKRIRTHLRSNVVGYIALFCFAFAGTASATHPGGANTISTDDIINAGVKTVDIGPGEVQAADIGNKQVTAPKMAAGSVGAAAVGNNSLSGIDIADTNSIGSIEVGGLHGVDVDDGSLRGADIADESLGALDLASGSVGNSELADGAVSSLKILDNNINGFKVLNDSLNGDDIQNLDGASIQGPEGWHQIGDPGEPAFEAGWQAGPFFTNEVGPGYYYDAVARIVHLRGQMNGGNGSSACAFSLPPGRTPQATSSYLAYLGTSNTFQTADFVLVRVTPNGQLCVNRTSIGTGVHISLDGISFRAA